MFKYNMSLSKLSTRGSGHSSDYSCNSYKIVVNEYIF
jgi:hypothetical protein